MLSAIQRLARYILRDELSDLRRIKFEEHKLRIERQAARDACRDLRDKYRDAQRRPSDADGWTRAAVALDVMTDALGIGKQPSVMVYNRFRWVAE